jgi:CRISPR system Cascade subunit CasD
MTNYLIFTLSATISAMGDLAGHQRRGTYQWPGRSALTGLLGAALGLQRTDNFKMIDNLGMAVAVFSSGDETSFRDYHTVETVPSAKAKQPNSRPEALISATGQTNTTITLRDYRTGFLCGVALWGGPLEHIRDALHQPTYTLYLGRKSCPLSAPVAAKLIDAATAEEAISKVQVPGWRKKIVATQLITDADATDKYVEVRHDKAIDRDRWHFEPRKVAFRPIKITLEAPG